MKTQHLYLRNLNAQTGDGCGRAICLKNGESNDLGQPKSSDRFAIVRFEWMERIENGFNPAGEPPE